MIFLKIQFKKLLIYIVITALIGSFFTIFTMDGMQAFQTVVNKPSFTPPGYVFGIAWTILYILMGVSWYLVDSCKPCVIAYFCQLIVNSLWTLIFFGWANYLVALIWTILLLGLIVYMILVFYPKRPLAAYLQIPYLLWTIFATILTYAVFILN